MTVSQQAEMNRELEAKLYELFDKAAASDNFTKDDLSLLAWQFGIPEPKTFNHLTMRENYEMGR